MRILIVDDDAIFAHMLAQLLEPLMPGCTVVAVDTADAARAAVRAAADPFDVLLLDVRLDSSDVDGVTLMEELRQLSPASDAIVFTGYDVEEGLRAFDAGAYRYLTKPFDTRELGRILKVLQKEREVRRERNWLAILAEISKELQGGETELEVGQIIVQAAPKLGFERARLWLFDSDSQELRGLCQEGHAGLEGFSTLRYKLEVMPYSLAALNEGKTVVFEGNEHGKSQFERDFAGKGFRAATGERIKAPLIVKEKWIGTLTLDNADRPQRYNSEQIELLQLFGNQAASALERAQLHEEDKLLSDIGRQVTAAAAQGDLEALLDEVRRQVGPVMDVTNFMVVLSDLETGDLDFRRQVEEGKSQDRYWRAAGAGLAGHVIAQNQAVLTDDTDALRAHYGISRRYGRKAECWLGVPLQVEDKAVGALVVQSYQDKAAYSERDKRLLQQVANQVAGAIRLAYRLEREAELKRQAAALEQLKMAMPELIREPEDLFWHAVLTTITHHDGNSFNRAILLWYDGTGENLLGRMAIGRLTRKDARLDWEHDCDAGHTLGNYFIAPRRAWATPTPLQDLVVGARWPIGGDDSPCRQVRAEGQRLECRSDALRGCLPDTALFPPDLWDDERTYACALLPVKSSDRVLGLLIVDNAFDGKPLRSDDLAKVEAWLAESTQFWLRAREADQTGRLGETYEQVLALGRKVRVQAASGQLKPALEELCAGAQRLTQADCVVVYPYHPSSGGYDIDLVSQVGLTKPEEFQVKAKPRQHGVTFSVLQSGTLVVPNVELSDLFFAGRKLSEHTFLQRQQIKALIGVPLREPAGEPLGVIYLDYHMPQEFDERAIALAKQIAAIGADAISYARAMERANKGQAAAEASDLRRQRDGALLVNIQAQALASDGDQEKVVRSILQNAAEMFRPAAVTLALLSWEAAGEENRQVRRDWRIDKVDRLDNWRADLNKGRIGAALREGKVCVRKNELVMPILFSEKPIAALMVRQPDKQTAFELVEIEAAERLVVVAAAALDNVRTRAYLQTVSQTVSAVSDLKGLKETLKTIVHKAREVAPDIDCVTLWYEDPETHTLVTGPQWGVRQEQHKGENAQTNRLVHAVMERQTPVFAPAVERDPILWGDFARDEGITSAAAFPLRFGAQPKALGALFLNYRTAHEFSPVERTLFLVEHRRVGVAYPVAHEFSPVERTLFPIFANAAATAIHSAQTIDLAEQRRRRLQTALDVATQAGVSLDRDKVLRGVLTVLRDAFPRESEDGTAPYIMLYDERDQVLELPEEAREFYRPDRPEYQHRVRLPLDGRGITTRTARQALKEGKIIVDNVKDVRDGSDYVEVNSKTRSEMCAGLVSEGRLLGALVIKSDRLSGFDTEDEKLFEMAAHQVSFALDRVELAARSQRDASVAGAMAWAADIAHDINNDIGYIRNRVYWLRGSEPPISEEGKTWAGEIDARAKQIADSVRDARFRWQEPEDFSLTALLHERAPAWAATRAANTEIKIEASDPFVLHCDREQLWRAVRHLLRNARDAMEAAHSAQRRITLRLLSLPSNQLELQVEDAGPGVADEARRRILREPYSTRDGEGRGYGLLIAQWLIESLGGSIYLYPSTPGCGARFGIHLPLKLQEKRHDHSE